MRHPVSEEFIYQGGVARARELGYPFYDTGKPCKRGHLSYRITDSCQCYACRAVQGVARGRRYRKRNPIKARLATTKANVARANRRGNNIVLDEAAYRAAWEDRPTHCPIFGVQLCTEPGTSRYNSAELDRVVPHLGYTEGNMRVISRRANSLKGDGTAAEHRAIAAWIDKENAK